VSARRRALIPVVCGVWVAACGGEPPPAPVYQAVPVERREIVVSAEAAGVIEPYVTVEVKSKASGEILEALADSGDWVERGTLLLRIDQRQLRNTLAQAKADLEVARARLANAEAQLRRSEKLYQAQSISETSYDQAVLDHATARAEVVRAEAAVENAQIEMDDADVLAPIDGTILQRDVERGQVISSPTRDVSGGTVLLTMAALEQVRVRTLVDETDIGKIGPGLAATVTVAAYPDRPFHGSVLKIEPQSQTEQNVTMFPTLVGLDNPEGLLKPGMNCEVEIHVDRRDAVLAIPNAALRTPRDVDSAAEVLGLSPDEVHEALAAVREKISPTESVEADPAPAAPRRPRGSFRLGGEYIVFTLIDGAPTARWIRTGLTDLDYSEVLEGLSESDSVLILPSAGLVRSQQHFRDRIRRVTGGGLPGVRKSK
jgi:HlyD family secretion protein